MVQSSLKKKRSVRPRKKTQWVFKVGVELTYNNRPKIAFLSGMDRAYFPEDPGFSKFSNENGPNMFDSPECKYTPPKDRLGKPTSALGYGMGGLSGPRFAKLIFEGVPSPDKYQRLLNEQRLLNKRRKLPPEDDYYKLSPLDPYVIKKKVENMRDRYKECRIGFGSMKSSGRFGNPPTFNTAGVGSYTPYAKVSPQLQTFSSFGRAPIIVKPATAIHCVIDPAAETCIDCGRSLYVSDFYRTRYPVLVPQPETRVLSEFDKDFPKGYARVNLCHLCYYRASRGSSKNWPQEKTRWLFQKTRTCATIHEHENIPQVIHKTRCKLMRRLQRKEAVLSRFYPDRIEETFRALDGENAEVNKRELV